MLADDSIGQGAKLACLVMTIVLSVSRIYGVDLGGLSRMASLEQQGHLAGFDRGRPAAHQLDEVEQATRQAGDLVEGLLHGDAVDDFAVLHGAGDLGRNTSSTIVSEGISAGAVGHPRLLGGVYLVVRTPARASAAPTRAPNTTRGRCQRGGYRDKLLLAEGCAARRAGHQANRRLRTLGRRGMPREAAKLGAAQLIVHAIDLHKGATMPVVLLGGLALKPWKLSKDVGFTEGLEVRLARKQNLKLAWEDAWNHRKIN